MQSKAGGMWKCGCNLETRGRIPRHGGPRPSPPPAFRCLHPKRKPERHVHLRSKIALPGISRGSLGLTNFFPQHCDASKVQEELNADMFPGLVALNVFPRQAATLQSRARNSVGSRSNNLLGLVQSHSNEVPGPKNMQISLRRDSK